ncbi:hypothetical protein [Thalassobacillus devorans]|uniref:hypothetical protein n=1 Tax=Thalassobacillus devorans TaxID=279813 RepID=UPI000A1C8B0D|nr:hypothetical protein [Thalassobacillus devorans]
MIQIEVLITAVLFLSVILFSSRHFYYSELKQFAKRIETRHGINLAGLNFSFEQMVYFISLPSNIPLLKKAGQEDVVIRFDYGSLLCPRVSGIEVVVETGNEHMSLAYLPIKDFRLPTLDKMFEEGKIDEKAYLKLSAAKLMEAETIKEIKEEVYQQIRRNREPSV